MSSSKRPISCCLGAPRCPTIRSPCWRPTRPLWPVFSSSANHEMSRELLWRGLETDPHATVFQQFWDVRESGGPAGSRTDIVPFIPGPHQQRLALPRGNRPGALSQTVFLIRSELLRRFPDARFYLVKARLLQPGGKTARACRDSRRLALVPGPTRRGHGLRRLRRCSRRRPRRDRQTWLVPGRSNNVPWLEALASTALSRLCRRQQTPRSWQRVHSVSRSACSCMPPT